MPETTTRTSWPHLASGSSGRVYEIRPVDGAGDAGPYYCTCPAWKFNRETPKACKHIHAMNGGSPAATPETVTASAEAARPARAADGSALPVPMKLETASDAALTSIVADPAWVMEQKVDGTRCTITVRADGSALFGNGQGGPLRHSTSLAHVEAITAALPSAAADGEYVLDGELLWTGVFWTFDLLRLGDVDYTGRTLADRRGALEALFAGHADPRVRLLPQARTIAEKQTLLRTVHDAGGEGVVLKRSDSVYVTGARVRTQVKVKFTKTVDAVVTARNTRGKVNADLAVYEDGVLRPIGSCSMNGKPDAQVGAVVEVKYLYATEDLTLYQPTLLRIRDDKPADDCHLAQLRPVSKAVLASVTPW